MNKSKKNSQQLSEREKLEAMIPPERRKELALIGIRKGAMMAVGMERFRKAQNRTGSEDAKLKELVAEALLLKRLKEYAAKRDSETTTG